MLNRSSIMPQSTSYNDSRSSGEYNPRMFSDAYKGIECRKDCTSHPKSLGSPTDRRGNGVWTVEVMDVMRQARKRDRQRCVRTAILSDAAE
jgi:hypothetical protein